jgi:hypothetical protein
VRNTDLHARVRRNAHAGAEVFIAIIYGSGQMLRCHGTFGQFRTHLGSGGNGREQSGKSGAIYAGA